MADRSPINSRHARCGIFQIFHAKNQKNMQLTPCYMKRQCWILALTHVEETFVRTVQFQQMSYRVSQAFRTGLVDVDRKTLGIVLKKWMQFFDYGDGNFTWQVTGLYFTVNDRNNYLY